MKTLPTYDEWMSSNKYWAGRSPANHAYFQQMYRAFCQKWRKENT